MRTAGTADILLQGLRYESGSPEPSDDLVSDGTAPEVCASWKMQQLEGGISQSPQKQYL